MATAVIPADLATFTSRTSLSVPPPLRHGLGHLRLPVLLIDEQLDFLSDLSQGPKSARQRQKMKTASGHGRKENRFLTFPHMFVKCFVLPAESNVFLSWFASPVSGAVVLYSQSQREQQPSQRAERRSKAASEATAGQHEKKKASKKVPLLQKPSLRINPSSSICVAIGCLNRSLFYTSTMSYRKDNSNLNNYLHRCYIYNLYVDF